MAAALLLSLPLLAHANEALIRKNLTERLAGLPKIEEVRLSAMPGLWEIRIGNEIRYTDATGSYLIEGELIDLKTRKNLTEERMTKINAVDFRFQERVAPGAQSGRGGQRPQACHL